MICNNSLKWSHFLHEQIGRKKEKKPWKNLKWKSNIYTFNKMVINMTNKFLNFLYVLSLHDTVMQIFFTIYLFAAVIAFLQLQRLFDLNLVFIENTNESCYYPLVWHSHTIKKSVNLYLSFVPFSYEYIIIHARLFLSIQQVPIILRVYLFLKCKMFGWINLK